MKTYLQWQCQFCGVSDPGKVENMKNLPIQIYHGSLDTGINCIS